MRFKRIMAAAVVAGVVAAGGAAAVAGQNAPARLGEFASWRAAQKAAGFMLLMPGRTYGQARSNKIIVTRCEQGGKVSKHLLVVATYGRKPTAGFTIGQSNSGSTCALTGKSRRLAKVVLHGVTAILSGECGMHGMPSCTSTRIYLFLTWQRHGIGYLATSYGERPKVLLGFARALKPVG
ncbi:MAG TPA: hypothetical protein VLX31_01495 [Streptosporangiaceae bacterium]|nr:hypothetical protein [Streptosporangiaceae bacterium]